MLHIEITMSDINSSIVKDSQCILNETNSEMIKEESIDFYKPMLLFEGKSIPMELLSTRFYDILSFSPIDSTGMHWNTSAFYDPKLKELYKSMMPNLPDKEEVVELIINSKIEMRKKILNSSNIILSYFEDLMTASANQYGELFNFDELIDALTRPPPYRFHNKFTHGEKEEKYGIWSDGRGTYGFDAAVQMLSTYTDIGQVNIGISCRKHGRFVTMANKHLEGGICHECKQLMALSDGEYIINNTLTNLNIYFKRELPLNKLGAIGRTSKLRFDFYIPSLNAAIEYDGIQHFEPVEQFGGEEAFEDNKIRDTLKNNFCTQKNIHLLRIPYTSMTVSKDAIDFITKLTQFQKQINPHREKSLFISQTERRRPRPHTKTLSH